MRLFIGHQGSQAQFNTCGIAACHPHHTRGFHGLTHSLGLTVDGFGQEFRAGMIELIPALKFFSVLQAKVRCKVNDPHAFTHEFTRGIHRHAVGRSKKHKVADGEICGIGRRKLQIVQKPPQKGKEFGDRFTGFGARGNRGDFHVTAVSQQAQQFTSRIACCAHNPDFDCLVHSVSFPFCVLSGYKKAASGHRPKAAFRFCPLVFSRTAPIGAVYGRNAGPNNISAC